MVCHFCSKHKKTRRFISSSVLLEARCLGDEPTAWVLLGRKEFKKKFENQDLIKEERLQFSLLFRQTGNGCSYGQGHIHVSVRLSMVQLRAKGTEKMFNI